jgi:hypothetical protein
MYKLYAYAAPEVKPPHVASQSRRDGIMITTQTSISLAKSLRLDCHCRHRQRKPQEGQTVQSKTPERIGGGTPIHSGLEIKATHSLSGRGRTFFLTSLFIESLTFKKAKHKRKFALCLFSTVDQQELQVILVTAPIVALDRLNSSVSLDDRRLEEQ